MTTNKLTSLLKEKFGKNTLTRQFDIWLLVCYQKYNKPPKGDCEPDLAFLQILTALIRVQPEIIKNVSTEGV